MRLLLSHEPCGDLDITVSPEVDVLVIDCEPQRFCVDALCHCGVHVTRELPSPEIAQHLIDGGATRKDIPVVHEPSVAAPIANDPFTQAMLAHQLQTIETIDDLVNPKPIRLTAY